jgi:hypothetical protein
MEDKSDKLRCANTKGEENGSSKLTDQNVISIRSALANGTSGIELSKLHAVSPQTISSINTGKTWKHVAA